MFGTLYNFFNSASEVKEKIEKDDILESQELSDWTLLGEQSIPELDNLDYSTTQLPNFSDESVSEEYCHLSSPSASSPILLSPVHSLSFSSMDSLAISPPLSPFTHLHASPPYPISLITDPIFFPSPKIEIKSDNLDFLQTQYPKFVATSSHDATMDRRFLLEALRNAIELITTKSERNELYLTKKELNIIKSQEKLEKRAISASLSVRQTRNNRKQLRINNQVVYKNSKRKIRGNLGCRKC